MHVYAFFVQIRGRKYNSGNLCVFLRFLGVLGLRDSKRLRQSPKEQRVSLARREDIPYITENILIGIFAAISREIYAAIFREISAA